MATTSENVMYPFLDALALARLEEARQATAIAELADESIDIAGGTMSYAGPGVWANQVCGIGLSSAVTDAELDRIVAFYDARGEPGEIEVASCAHETCIRGLGSRGFVLKEIEYVFAIDGTRTDIDPISFARLEASGLEMLRVDPSHDSVVDEFVEVGTRGFKAPGETVLPDEIKLLRRVVAHPRTSAWIVRFEGQTCGVTAMECAGDVACLFATTVTPEFRGRGIQRALMEARLRHGLDAGCRYVCIHSAAGIATERNARRLGMELCYVKAILTRSR
ncbi:MAG: GNAT family N-acetyltransferase [Planctomycetes bacterium]|nr:GNAT family N-acetyltransferase [Planctomycetota bacterium]